jgi:hypothetical protein
VLEYAASSAPAVMIPELSTAFARTAVGVGAILGGYYYTYSITSLFAVVICMFLRETGHRRDGADGVRTPSA